MKKTFTTITLAILLGMTCYFIYFINTQTNQQAQIACQTSCSDNHQIGNHFNTACSITAAPDSTTVFQPDGTALRVFVKGNQALHYLETEDGYTILKDKHDDTYKYAFRNTSGRLRKSDIIVHPVANRTNEELTHLTDLQKNIRPDRAIQAQILEAHQEAYNSTLKSSGSDFPTNGYNTTLMILIDYPDQPFSYPFQNFIDLANQSGYNYNGASGSFKDYFLAQSNGQLEVGTHVWGWFRAQHHKAYYKDKAPQLVREAVNIVETGGFDFNIVDNTHDGEAEAIMVVHSGRGQEESGNSDDIWSHHWSMSAQGQDVTYDGVHIDRYIIQPEKYGWNSMTNVGIFCHEFGHALGLPDLYDTDGTSSGVGNFCTMGSGSWLNNGKTPANLSAWSKKELGWANPTVYYSGSDEVTVNQNSEPKKFLPSYYSSEYFLTEYRKKTGWDAYLPAEGLAIWHINDGAYYQSNELNPIVSLEQADGLFHLHNGYGRGDSGDLYPGSTNNGSFNPASTPNTNLNNGAKFNFSITDFNVQWSGGTSYRYSFGYCAPSFNENPWQPVHITNVSFKEINNQTNTWEAPNQIKDYTNQSAYVEPGNYVNLSVSTHANSGVNHGVKVWIDFNGDLDFLDAGELVLQSNYPMWNTAHSNFYIPHDAPLGNVRMRVLASTGINSISDGCDDAIHYTDGEIEDYTINIGYCPSAGQNTEYEYIHRVQFGYNYTTHYAASPDGFRDLTNGESNFYLQTGQSTLIDLQPGFSGVTFDENWRVWADWNQDGDFYDAGELFYDSNIHGDFYPNEGRAGAYRTLPYNAKPGTTRMRIAMAFGEVPNLCSDVAFGEVWDVQTTITNPTFYCSASGETTVDEWIERVGLKDLINQSGNNYGYADFTNSGQTTDLAKSENYDIKLTPGHTDYQFDENWKVWIDWNQDGDFYDSYEAVFETYYGSNSEVIGSIYVPWFAQTGTTQMRVMMHYGNGDYGPCDEFTYGEVEDYTINVVSYITGAPELGPMADFVANRNIVKPYTTVTLTDKSYNSPEGWYWSVRKDGVEYFTSEEQSPTFAFTKEGDYEVELMVWNDEGEHTHWKEKYIRVVAAETNLEDVKKVAAFDFSLVAASETVHLEWIKTHNKAVDYFEVERSFDGNTFEKIESVTAELNDEAALYTIDDLTPQIGQNFYRIHTIYEDGTGERSNIKQATIVEVLDFTLFPNPTQDFINVNLKEFIGQAAQISIQSNNGQVIKQVNLSTITTENQQVDLQQLKDGQYTMSVSIPNRRMQTRKFVIATF